MVYSLLQDRIVELLVEEEFFIKCIGFNYDAIAKRWGCGVWLSRRRLREAHDFWQEDVGRTLRENMPEGTRHLDHFKNASFIAFWLRRMLPLNETQKAPFNPTARYNRSDTELFFQYGNEITALTIGFQICLFYEAAKGIRSADDVVVPIHQNRIAFLRTMRFPEELLTDFAMVLKHKNISPHSLYLMYKSLFSPIGGK